MRAEVFPPARRVPPAHATLPSAQAPGPVPEVRSSMNRVSFLLGRLLQMVVVLWVVATLLFLIFRLMPGNPLVAYIDTNFTAEMQQALLRQFGLDRPLHVQYAIFLRNLVRGEFGRSFFSREPVSQVMWQVLPNTLVLH